MKKIDIVIPVYNKEKYISPLLDSLIPLYSYVDKIILVDDFSTDQSVGVIKSYIASLPTEYDGFITLFELDVNGGPQFARVFGANNSNKDWIFFLDADDFISSKSFAYCIDKLDSIESDVSIMYGYKYTIPENTLKVDDIKLEDSLYSNDSLVVSNHFDFIRTCIPPMSGLFIKKKYVSLMKNNSPWGEDIVYFCDLLHQTNYRYFKLPLSLYRQGVEGSRGSKGGELSKRIKFIMCLFNNNIFSGSVKLLLTSILYRTYFSLRCAVSFLYKKIKC